MNKTLSVMVMALMIGLSAPAKSQEDAKVNSSQYKPGPISSFDERYDKCLNEPKCPIQLRLQLMDELYGKMGRTLSSMNAVCAKTDYKDCIVTQRNNLLDWYKIEGQMTAMMLAIEGRTPAIMALTDDSKKPQ